MSDARDLFIRPFEDGDESDVAALWREVFANDPPWNEPTLVMEKKRAVQRELFFVAVLEGRIAGTAMSGYDGHRGWVYAVAVSPSLRRRGVGRALMDRVESALAGLGCLKLNLQVRSDNEAVLSFYRRLGYSPEPRASMGKLLEPGLKYRTSGS
ncbi:MAG: GNAT family acetyltransferase [Gammaproteobacteria bacterium]|nr:GNAT family acetyltransferase [Gammaproteobacteria bacterium]